MPTVKTVVDDATYQQLVRLRRIAGRPSVSALFLERCGLLTDNIEAREIVTQAFGLAARREPEVEFRLRDLFTKERWERFSKGARLSAGKMFTLEVGRSRHGIRATRKSAANAQFYVLARPARRG